MTIRRIGTAGRGTLDRLQPCDGYTARFLRRTQVPDIRSPPLRSSCSMTAPSLTSRRSKSRFHATRRVAGCARTQRAPKRTVIGKCCLWARSAVSVIRHPRVYAASMPALWSGSRSQASRMLRLAATIVGSQPRRRAGDPDCNSCLWASTARRRHRERSCPSLAVLLRHVRCYPTSSCRSFLPMVPTPYIRPGPAPDPS